jgi:hypothetical protein
LSKLAETGGNKSWNITGKAEDFETTRFISVSNLPFKNDFPGCNLAAVDELNPDDGYQMIESNSNGLFLLGLRADTLSIVLSPKYTVIPFPLSFGQNYQNNVNASFNVDTSTVKVNIQSNATVDAWGTITTNEGSYPALKIKIVQIQELSIDGIPFGSTLFAHTWLTSGIGGPLARFEIEEVESPFGGLETDTSITYIHRHEIVSTKNVKESNSKLTISPNPVIDQVSIKVDNVHFKSAEYSIINAEGKRMMEGKINDNEVLHLNLQHLIPGNYLVQLLLDKQTLLFDIVSKK